jgi:transposase
MSKAGPAILRAVFYMAAVVGTRYNPHVKTVYKRLLARGKSKIPSLGAVMRKLVHLCFGVLKLNSLSSRLFKKCLTLKTVSTALLKHLMRCSRLLPN